MKLKLLKDVRMRGAPTVMILEGSTVDATDDTANTWIKAGVAVTCVTPVTNTGSEDSVTKKDVTPVTKEEKKRKQTADRVQRFRAKGKMITIRHTSGKIETLPGDQAMKLIQEGKAELVGETAMTNPPEVR